MSAAKEDGSGGILSRIFGKGDALDRLTRRNEGVGDWSSMYGTPSYALEVNINTDVRRLAASVMNGPDFTEKMEFLRVNDYVTARNFADRFFGEPLVVTNLGYIRQGNGESLPLYRARLDLDDQILQLIRLRDIIDGQSSVHLHYENGHEHSCAPIGKHLMSLVFWPPKEPAKWAL